MPTYEYACAACKHEWEQTQRITEAPVEVCPVCAKATAHRLISAGTNFILKGSGWYSDLYASPKPPAGKPEGKSEKSEKSETKGETSEKKAETSEKNAPSPPDGSSKSATKPAATETTGSSSSTSSTSSSVPSS
jgi:putative FmdB family regulatory protein